MQDSSFHRFHTIFALEECIFRVRSVPDKRFCHLLLRLSPAISLLEVADILINQFRLLIFLISILEDLGMLTDFNIEFTIVYIIFCFFTEIFFISIALNLYINMSRVIKSLSTASEMVNLSGLDGEGSLGGGLAIDAGRRN